MCLAFSGPLILIRNGSSPPLAVGPYVKQEWKSRVGLDPVTETTHKGEQLMPLALSCNHLNSFWGHWYAHYLRNAVPKVKAGVLLCMYMPLLGTQALYSGTACSWLTHIVFMHPLSLSDQLYCDMNLWPAPCLTLTMHLSFICFPSKAYK